MEIYYNYDSEKYNIGDFKPYLITEKAIDPKRNFENYKVNINPNEGNIPHMHLCSNDKPDVCIYIYDNKYFTHGIHVGVLESGEDELFNEWMRKRNKKYSINGAVYTNWEVADMLWWEANGASSNPRPINAKQPGYSYIKPYKEKK